MVQRADSHDDVYDRQIRLWGADAQKRMSNARVLYVRLTGVTCEIMKNLVLAGVAAAVCDDRPYPEAVREMPCSFFRAGDMEAAAGGASGEGAEPDAKKAKTAPKTVAAAIQPKVEELNPLLAGRNSIEERSLASLPDDYFAQFDAVVASRLTVDEAKRISSCLQKVEEGNKLFIVTDTFGLDGCAQLDFGKGHTYRREVGKDKLSDLQKVEPYLPLEQMLGAELAGATGRWDKQPPRILAVHRLLMEYWGRSDKPTDFAAFAQEWLATNKLPADALDLASLAGIARHPEVSPVCAVLGGMLGNEVIKALTGKGEPANNVMLFDGMDGGCRSFLLKGKE
ncbi:hypothetical protein ACHAXT_010437 [Thalassiosira profunda]